MAAAANRIPDRLARVVYVDSGPLPAGTAQFDTNPPERRARLERDIKERGDGWLLPAPDFDPAADPAVLADLSAADLELLKARCTPEPLGVATQPAHSTATPGTRCGPT